MLLKDIYKDLDVYINEDGTDDYYAIVDFSRRVEEEQINLVIDVMNEEERLPFDRRPMTDYLLASETQPASTSYYNWELPEDYLRFKSMVYIPTSGIKQPVEIISPDEFIKRGNDILSPPTEENPIVYIEDGDTLHRPPYYAVGRWFLCYPQYSSGTWGLFYIKSPTPPFLDYYIDTNRETVYLDYGDDLSVITTGTYRDGRNMNIVNGTATTQELEIPDEFHDRLIGRLMERLGIKDRDNVVIQHSMAKDQIEKTDDM